MRQSTADPNYLTFLLIIALTNANELTECCKTGRRHFEQTSTCSKIRLEENDGTCSRTASICCMSALLEQSCELGTKMAIEEEYCPTNVNQIGGGLRKECCDCCLLAKELSRQRKGCVSPDGFSTTCSGSFRRCCSQKFDVAHDSQLHRYESHPDSVGLLRVEDRCASAKCEHVCTDRGGASVECSCRPGYDLGPDGFSCIALEDHNFCGVSFKQSVATGFRRKLGTEMVEFQTATTACAPNERCERMPDGSYSCVPDRQDRLLSDDSTTGPFGMMGAKTVAGYGIGTDEQQQQAAMLEEENGMICPVGWEMSSSGQCVDVDECNLGSHDCGPLYQCRNTQGSYRCDPKKCAEGELMNPRTGECASIDCPVGYKPISGRCEDVNECEVPGRCRQFEECINTPGSFRCQELGNLCTKGYRMDRDTGFCVDINECTEGIHLCGDRQCINLLGSYKCRCSAGFEFNETTKRCEDVDECMKFAGHVCSLHATCENTYGSFKCHCKDGFTIAKDARNCDDIDECSLGIAQCAQKCVNIPGSYQCICERGYRLGADGITCEDIDECTLWAGSGDDLCMGSCINTPGSYRCQCPVGYEIQDDGRTCKDIDECAKGECHGNDQICVNTLGSFKCHIISCPPNYVHDKNYKNRCNRVRRLCDLLTEEECKNRPIRISWEFTSIPRQEPISSRRTSITLFTIRGPTSPSSSVQFELKLKSAIPEKYYVLPAVRSNFLLQKGEERNAAVIALRDSLDGPQEIILELILRLSIDSIFQSKYIANLVINVAPHRRQRITPLSESLNS